MLRNHGSKEKLAKLGRAENSTQGAELKIDCLGLEYGHALIILLFIPTKTNLLKSETESNEL